MTDKLRVGVIFGGRSGEHEVSLQSAASVIKAINQEKYEVVPIFISKEGVWLSPVYPEDVINNNRQVLERAARMALLPDPLRPEKLIQIDGESSVRLDLVFPILHGPFGEDGTVQGLLELANIPFVGSGVAASALGMDKALMKVAFAQAGLPQVRFLVFLRSSLNAKPDEVVAQIDKELEYPCFVKPANLGSSVGISKVKNRDGLLKALRLAAKFDRKIVVEQGVNAREIEVSVLGNDEVQVSIPGEIVPSNEFYDYKAKYIDGKSSICIPADLPETTKVEIQRLAVKAFKAIDAAGFSRVDFFVDREDGSVYVNEINTLPGFTSISMYPKLWEASGVPYPTLIDKLIELAIERHKDKNLSLISYEATFEE